MHEARLVKMVRPMDARTVARTGLDAMMAGKPLVIAGTMNRLAAWSTRFAPRQLATKLARAANSKA